MPRKKLDNRLKVMIENGVELKHRTMFVIVGDKGKDQVVILHHMLSKAAVKARPSVLWCYKKELGFSSNRKKRMKQLQKKITTGSLDVNEDDPFELFVTATNIRYCYYAETHKILGNTYGMCVLQDFEAITPNLLARTIETVEGGGIIVILLQSVNSLKQLYTMSMDVHARYRTEAHQEIVGRFNERFILSLVSCKRCIVIDDALNILPLSSHCLSVQPVPRKPKEESLSEDEKELAELKASLQDTQPVGVLANCCRTLDQARALLKFIESISEKTLRSTVALTAARGRGKSAALGLAISAAVAFNYSNIFVTSPSPENLNTLFEFVLKGFDVLEYTEHMDYELIQSTNPEFNKAVIRLNIFREHRQTIQYIHPSDAHKLGQAELLVIDEAAAIPLPLVRNLLGPYLVFMSSTINGYEGTGRSLSLKLIQQLRNQTVALGEAKNSHVPSKNQKGTENKVSTAGRILHEVQLNESIRYRQGDAVESWLNELLCLDAAILPHLSAGCPLPQNCDLYYINRDTLFCYHKASEIFLQRLMALYVASHYKNSPNDLQMLSDAPAHHLFCLLGPVDPTMSSLPEVLCVIQVCMEGAISQESVCQSLSRGKRASGDLIPWTVAQQFQDEDFPSLCGARIIRIATHPDYQKMGYGGRALELLQQYYEGHIMNIEEENVSQEIEPTTEESVGLLEEEIRPRKSLPPLLLKLSERKPELLDYLGVSFGVTNDLLRFWKRAGYVPVYIRQTASDLTGEHSCIMLKALNVDDASRDSSWLNGYWIDFRKRFVCLLGFQFRSYQPSFALSILQNKNLESDNTKLDKLELQHNFSNYDLKRLELYAKNMADYHIITDLLPAIAKLYFMAKLDLSLSLLQSALLLGMGLQYKTVDEVSKELDLPASQLLGLFNRAIRKISQYLREILETAVAKTLIPQKPIVMEAAKQTVDDDLEEGAKAVRSKQKKDRKTLEDSPVEESEPAIELGFMKNVDLAQYKIKGAEAEWQKALKGGSTAVVSVKGKNRKRNRDKMSKSFAIGATKSMKEGKKKRK